MTYCLLSMCRHANKGFPSTGHVQWLTYISNEGVPSTGHVQWLTYMSNEGIPSGLFMFFSLVKILHSLVKIKDEVCLLFAEILPKRYSLVIKILKCFCIPYIFWKEFVLYDNVCLFNKNVCYLFWTVSSCICRNIRVISSAQAQFVTALLKLILAQAQPQKYHEDTIINWF